MYKTREMLLNELDEAYRKIEFLESKLSAAGRKQKLTNEQIDIVLKLRKAGISYKKIAEEMSCSVGLIHKITHSSDESLNGACSPVVEKSKRVKV